MTPSKGGKSKKEPNYASWFNPCCGGLPCANNRTKSFINKLFSLYERDKQKARNALFEYMESVETDRDWAKLKLKELQRKRK